MKLSCLTCLSSNIFKRTLHFKDHIWFCLQVKRYLLYLIHSKWYNKSINLAVFSEIFRMHKKIVIYIFCRLWHDRDRPCHAVYTAGCATEQDRFMWANCTLHRSQNSGPNNRAVTGASSVRWTADPGTTGEHTSLQPDWLFLVDQLFFQSDTTFWCV